MKKLKKIILILNIISAILMIIAYLLLNYSPEKSLIITLVPFIYFILLAINILFMIFWIIFKLKLSLVSLIAIIITFKAINLIFPFTSYTNPGSKKEGELKIMSYNVMVFGLYNWNQDNNIKSSILNIIKEQSPDIICIQEAFWNDKNKKNFMTLDSVKIVLDAGHMYKSPMANAAGGQNFGLATVSRYPIINSFSHRFEDSFNGFIFTDILIEKDTVRVYNCHLQSLQLEQSDYTLIETLAESELSPKIKIVLKKYLKSSQKRAQQSKIVRSSIDSCKYPVFVCGDFNDMPVSYTYSKIKSGLKDSFTSRGKFPGYTWNSFKIKQRIDYILFDKKFDCTGHNVIQKEYSDHYPVVAEFNIKAQSK